MTSKASDIDSGAATHCTSFSASLMAHPMAADITWPPAKQAHAVGVLMRSTWCAADKACNMAIMVEILHRLKEQI